MELSPYTVILQMINFIVLVLILRRFLFGPVMRMLNQRQELVQADLDQAAQAHAQAEQLYQQGERAVAEANQRVEQLLRSAEQHAEKLQADAAVESEARARRLIDEAEARLRREQEKAILALRQEAARLAVSVAMKALPKALDTDQQRRLLDQAIREVGSDDR